MHVVIARAEGKSWKQVEAVTGVDYSTIWLWRREHPIDRLVAQLALDTAKSALVRMTAKMEQAADVVCDHLDGTFTATALDEQSGVRVVDYEAERLRAQAAKTMLGLVAKLIERAQGTGEPPRPQRAAALPSPGEQPAGKAAAERLRKR